MSFQFANAWVLYLLWLVPLMGVGWYAVCQRRQRALERFLSAEMRQKLAPPPRRRRFAWQLTFGLCGLLLLLLALARPRWGTGEERVIQKSRDLLIVLDVSRSMLATDVRPDRLTRAKLDIMDLIRELQGDRVGLLVFRGKATALCPLTTDYAYFQQAIDSAGIESAPRGETDIGDAIFKALDAFQGDEGAHKAIILVSDGEDLAGHAAEVAQRAAERRVPIFTVGLGSPQGSRIPASAKGERYLSYQGTEVISRLEHQTLKMIAETTGGAYVPVGLANVRLGTLYRNHLSKLAAQDVRETLMRRYVERYQMFLLPSFLCWLAAAFMSQGRLAARSRPQSPPAPDNGRALRRRAAPAAALVLAVAGCALAGGRPCWAQTNPSPPSAARKATDPQPPEAEAKIPRGRAGAQRAQRLYAMGRYQDAAKAYANAAAGAGHELEQELLFNAACADYRAARYAEAAHRLNDLTGQAASGLKPGAVAYNRGCALYRQAGKAAPQDPEAAQNRASALKEATRDFQEAMRLRADDPAAGRNFAVAAEALPKAEEEARIARLLAQYDKVSPSQLAGELLQKQREVVNTIPCAFSNSAPSQISDLEKLAAEQKTTADLLVPLKAKLAAAASLSSTNARTAAAVADFVEHVRDEMKSAASKLRDLDETAYPSAVSAGEAVYNLWKGIAASAELLREDLQRQTNAIGHTGELLARPSDEVTAAASGEQTEARELTKLFSERFAREVPSTGLPAQPAPGAATGAPTLAKGAPPTQAEAPATNMLITAETRATILDLAGQAEAAQNRAAEHLRSREWSPSLKEQRTSYDLLRKIQDLLPKEKKSQPQEDRNKEEDQKNEQPQPQPEQQPQPQPQPKEQPQPEKKEMTPLAAEQILLKALQREKDHLDDKRQRETYLPPSPVNRDW